MSRKSHHDSAVRFVTAKSCPERATKTQQYDLLRPRVVQKEPPRLGSTICYGQELARKSHQDSAVRFVTAKSWPERAAKTRQYDLLRPNVGQKESPRLGSTICYGQELARKSHQDSAVRFVTAKSWPERATKTRQYDLLRPRVESNQHSAMRFVTAARKSHQDSAVRFVTAKSCQKEPPRLGSTIWYGQTWARKSHQNSAVGFVTAKTWPERATKTRQYDLLRPNVGQKEPPRLGSTVCYDQQLARKSHRDSAVRFVTDKHGPERATKTRQYDLLRPNVGQKEPSRLSRKAAKTRQNDLLRRRAGKKGPLRIGSTFCSGQTWARKSHQDSAVRLVTAKSWPERATETRQYDLLRPNVGQKEPPRLGSTICYDQELARKSRRDSAVRFLTAQISEKAIKIWQYDLISAKSWPERATKTRQYDLLRPRVDQKEPPYDLFTAKRWQERATKTRPYDLLRQSHQDSAVRFVCGQTWARKSHRDSTIRFVTAKPGPERATKTQQYDLLRPNVGQKEPLRLGSAICYGQELAR